MADYRRARWGVRRTFQTEQAIEKLSVFDNVAMIYEHSGVKGGGRRAEVQAALDFVGLETPSGATVRRPRRPRAATRRGRPGRRRADRGWCCSTSLRPACPTEETEHLSNVIKAIPDRFGALVILVDHDMSLVSGVLRDDSGARLRQADRLGTTDDVLQDDKVMLAYLGTEEVT